MTSDLKALIGQQRPLILPGVPNALSARLAVDVGFEALYVSGAGVTNTNMGLPDLGFLSLPELLGHVSAIADVVDVPLVVDADTGFGNAVNVQHTVRRLERAGASAVQIEDQVSPKKCGHFDGKQVVSLEEMVGKIHAAVDARSSEDFLVVARTDVAATGGISQAIERAQRFAEAGADVLFVEAPRSAADMRRVTTEVPGLHLANIVEGGLTPAQSRAELADLGYSIGLYANAAMRGGMLGMRRVLEHLAEHGDTREAGHLIASWQERQSLVGKADFDEAEKRYAPENYTALENGVDNR
jgi:2-methylisocitrate lyase-like PEP mutase family enzyme